VNNNNNKNKIADWLEDLQRESWQLELIISGFSIFLLFQAGELVSPLFYELNTHTNFSGNMHGILINALGALFFAIYTLIACLILHIILRGFWIAAIGLRSVQRETDFDKLNYGSFFTNKLKKSVLSLDQLIQRLDTISSVVFAFAFLVVFMFISFGLWVFFVNSIGMFFNLLDDYVSNPASQKILEFLVEKFLIPILIISSLIYLLDTLSLGFFKKYNWLSKLYYPFYKFWGWITMAGIYRSIYYNLVSRFPKNNIRFLLIISIFLLSMYPSNRITFYKYYPDRSAEHIKVMTNRFYDDIREADRDIYKASIPSEVIKEAYFPLFIKYSVKHNEVIDSLCTNYTATKTSIWVTGIKFNKGIRINDPYDKEEEVEKLLNCLSSLYEVSINDSTYTNIDYYFYRHPNDGELGIKTMIDARNLPKGKNTITIKRHFLTEDKEIDLQNYVTIPFWLE